MLTNALLYAGLLPLVVSACLAVILRQLRLTPQISWPVSITAGFLAAMLVVRGQGGLAESIDRVLHPHEALDWLPVLVLLALVACGVVYWGSLRSWQLIPLVVAISLATPVRLLSGNLAQQWSPIGKLAVIAWTSAALALAWLSLSTNDTAQPSVLRVPLQILVAVGAGVAVTLSGAFIYGQLAAAVGAATTGTWLAFALRARESNEGTAAAAGVVAVALGSLILLGRFYSELNTAAAALLFVALAATAVPLPGQLGGNASWLQAVVRAACCLVPLTIAVALAVS